ncbi:HEAT repeat domain-containing protein [Chloroflexota bacterium]
MSSKELTKQQASPELINKLKERDSSVRQNATKTIGVMGDENSIGFIIAVLMKDNNRYVRQEGVHALGQIGGTRALEALTQALVEEKNIFVQDSIKKAIEELQPK